jgi:hypothetical protein
LNESLTVLIGFFGLQGQCLECVAYSCALEYLSRQSARCLWKLTSFCQVSKVSFYFKTKENRLYAYARIGAFDVVEPQQFPSITEKVPTTLQELELEFPVVNIETVTKSKLAAFYTRSSNNDFLDLIYLVNTFYIQIHGFRTRLNYNQREAFYNRFVALSDVSAQMKRRVKHTLGIA